MTTGAFHTIQREWTLKVISKQESGNEERGWYYLTLREPKDPEADRPLWTMRDWEGGPVQLQVSKAEFDSAQVGDQFTVRVARTGLFVDGLR